MKNLFKKILKKIISARSANQRADKIPGNVVTAFFSKYPQARLKNWRNEHDVFIAAFVSRNNKYDAFYSAEGQWLKTEMKIALTRGLPPAISQSLKKSEFATWHITGIRKLDVPDQYLYIVRVESSSPHDKNHNKLHTTTLLYFNPDGRLIEIGKEEPTPW